MPKSSKISDQEKLKIAQIAVENDQFGPTELGKLVNRSKSSISRLMSSDIKFNNFRNKQRKKMIRSKIRTLEIGEKQLLRRIKEMTPYQLIGMNKIYWEQIFGHANLYSSKDKVADISVQIVQGDKPYSSNVEAEE